jgi:hypothetical protein
MKKILTYLSRIPKDKWQHFSIGAVLAPCLFLLVWLFFGFWPGLVASIVTVAVIAKAKEIWDSKNGSTFDWMDFFATVAGGVPFWLASLIIWLL